MCQLTQVLFEEELTGSNVTAYKHISPFLSVTPMAIHVSLKKTDRPTLFKVSLFTVLFCANTY